MQLKNVLRHYQNRVYYKGFTMQLHYLLVVVVASDDKVMSSAVAVIFATQLSQYSTVVLTVVRVMIAKYRKSGIWGYRSSLTPEPVELK